MSEPLNAPQAEEAPLDRKELLAQQLSEAESSPATTEERPRDEKGRFAASGGGTTPDVDKTVEITVPEEPPLWQRPPASWKKDKHELWAKAVGNPELAPLAEYAWQREQEMAQGVEPLKTKAQIADAFESAVAPYRTIMQGLGVEPIQAIQGLMQNDYILRFGSPEEKRAKVVELVNAYGIDLNNWDQSQVQAVDPNYQALQNQLLELRGQYLTDKQMAEQAEEQAMLREATAVTQGLEHYEAVKDSVIAILQAGLVPEGSIAEMTKAAYEKAIRLDDDLFKSIQEGQQAQAEAAKRQAAHNAAQVAKRAAVSVPSSTPGAATISKAQDRRSLLLEQFSNIGERL